MLTSMRFNKQTVFSGFWTIAALCSLIVFSFIFFSKHAYGSWGDDASGYTFLANRILHHEPIVFFDPIVKQGLDHFQDPKAVEWLLPTHYRVINADGTIASKYPIGLSLLMAVVAALFQTEKAIYLVVPLCSVLSLIVFWAVIKRVFRESRYAPPLACVGILLLGTTQLYAMYSIAQPLREIPSILFLLISLLCFLYIPAQDSPHTRKRLLLFLFTGFFLGIATAIRETSILFLIALVAFQFTAYFTQKKDAVKLAHVVVIPLSLILLGSAIGYLPQAYNDIQIFQHNNPSSLTTRSEQLVLPNSDHVESLSVSHWFVSEGKFRPTDGNIRWYLYVLQTIIPIPLIFCIIVLGGWALYKQHRSFFALTFTWCLLFFLFFAAWINPYPRYLLPLIPAYVLLYLSGWVWMIEEGVTMLTQATRSQLWLRRAALVICCLTLLPSLLSFRTLVQTSAPIEKGISQADFETVRTLAATVQTVLSEKESIIMVTGAWSRGMSEHLYGHEQIRTIRSPREGKRPVEGAVAKPFFDEMLQQYDMYVWIDETTRAETIEFLDAYGKERIGVFSFGFQDTVELYRLTQK